MSGYFPVQVVMEGARGRWGEVLGRLGINGALLRPTHGPCPGCGGRDRFRFDDQNGEGTFLCSQGGQGNLAGNGLALLLHCTGWEWKKGVEEVGRLVCSDAQRVGGHALAGASAGTGSGEGGQECPRSSQDETAEEPVAEERPNVPVYDEGKLREYVAGIGEVTREGLRAMSPVRVEGVTGADFIEALYGTGERVLVFTEFRSQGNFLYEVGRGGYRLGQQKGVKAVSSALPVTGKCGVWFLSNPVTGLWDTMDSGKLGRRHWKCVTSFRYAVLESDEAPEELWLKALVRLPVPIVAIYSSGGKSLHALVRVEAGDKLTWDLIMRGKNARTRTREPGLLDLVCPLGADANALTAVRLTRLPGCVREGTETREGYQRYATGRLQELVWMEPPRLHERPVWRSLEMRIRGVG